MPKKQIQSSFSQNCRVCLNQHDCMSDIFVPDIRSKIEQLSDSVTIHIKDDNDGLPKLICHICLYKLEMWCEFRSQFIQANETLLKYLGEPTTKVLDHTLTPAKRKYEESTPPTETLENNQDEPENKKVKLDEPSQIPEESQDNNFNSPESKKPEENVQGNCKLDSASTSGCVQSLNLSPTTKIRQFAARRTTEQRLASTQRWEARKKALLAATGENDSDSDSMASADDTQLSPVQKARAKNNAQKEADKQRTKAVNNLELTQPSLFSNQSNETLFDEANLSQNDIPVTVNHDDKPFEQKTLQSEMTIGDSTFVVTTTLVLADSNNCEDKSELTNSLELNTSENSRDQNPEQNSDIFDAVKLRRINPIKPTWPAYKNIVKRCLNVEVEGTDASSLQRIQNMLATFVETDMKHNLLNNVSREEKLPLESVEALEQELKMVVESTVKQYVDTLKMKRVGISKIATNNRGDKTFSAAFIKAAKKSQIFQPKVLLNRVIIAPEAISECPSKDSQVSKITATNEEDLKKKSEPRLIHSTRSCSAASKIHTSNIETLKKNSVILTKSPQNLDKSTVNNSVCGLDLPTQHQTDSHSDGLSNESGKQKLMRCKRCHEIVQAILVKSHICKRNHTCNICGTKFRTESMLSVHKSIHNDQVKIERVPNLSQPIINDEKVTEAKPEEMKTSSFSCFVCDKVFKNEENFKDHLQQHSDNVSDDERTQDKDKDFHCAICGEAQSSEDSLEKHVEKHLFEDDDQNPNAINVPKNNLIPELVTKVPKNNQIIELVRKIPNNNQINKLVEKVIFETENELHSCIQCFEEFESEVNLVLHMQAHEEEAAIAEWEKQGVKIQQKHICTVCDEAFESERALADHFDIHNNSSHICQLCDKPLLTLAELQEHVNSHFS